MRRSYFHLCTAILVLSIFALASSCTLTRWVPENEFLLMDNQVRVQLRTDDLDGLNAMFAELGPGQGSAGQVGMMARVEG